MRASPWPGGTGDVAGSIFVVGTVSAVALVVAVGPALGVSTERATWFGVGTALGWVPALAGVTAWARRVPDAAPRALLGLVLATLPLMAVVVVPHGTASGIVALSIVPLLLACAMTGTLGPETAIGVGLVAWLVADGSSGAAPAVLGAGLVAAEASRRATVGERERLAGQVSHERGKVRAIATGVAEAVVVTTPEGRIREWNAAATTTFGVPEAQAVGRTCQAVLGLHRDVAVLDCATGCAALRDEHHAEGLDWWRTGPTGARQPVLVNVTPVRSPTGRIREVVHSVRDISRLRMADEAKTLFLATASHELKTPLSVIRGFSEVLLGDEVDDDTRRLGLEAIQRRAIELTGIVDRLLMSSRIEAGRVDMSPTPGDLVPVLAERVASLSGATDRTVRLVHPETVPPVILDPGAVATVIDHLIENALKYSSDAVDLAVTVAAERVEVAVTDRGVGMTDEQIERCFDKFWQAESTDVRRFGGTGIGLYIVRALVEAMLGRIWVESSPGVGSTFRVTFRRADAPTTEAPATAAESVSIIDEFMRQVGLAGDAPGAGAS